MVSASPIQRINTCAYCPNYKIHIIDPGSYPNDVIAEKDANGKWICGNCQENNIKKRIAESKKRRGITA